MTMTALMILIAAICVFHDTPAQFISSGTDSRASALGGAYVSLSDKSSAVFYNPSGLAQINNNHLSVYYEPALYGLGEISTGALTYARPIGFASAGFGFRTFGFDLYRESVAAAGIGAKVSDKILLGGSVNCYNLSIKGYGSSTAYGFDLGAMTLLTDEIKWGFTVKNVTGTKIGSSGNMITRLYSAGFSWTLIGGMILSGDIEKKAGLPLNIKAGAEANPVAPVFLRAGISSEPSSFSAGVGLKFEMFTADYCASFTEPLGVTNRFSISAEF